MKVYKGKNLERTKQYLDKFTRKKVLKSLIKKDNPTIFDIGANVGVSISEFKAWWPNSIIHAFEPLSDCWDELKKTTSVFNNTVIINNFALGSSDDDLATMYTHNPSDLQDSRGISGFLKVNKSSKDSILLHELSKAGSDSLREYYKSINHTQSVKMLRADTYLGTKFPGIKKIDLIKIDVQGFEPEVLEGFGHQLRKAEVVISELQFYDYYERSISFTDIEKYLHKAGFKLYDISHISKNPMNGRTDWVDVIYVKYQ